MANIGAEIYDPSDPEAPPVQIGRRIFLDRVERVAPQVVTSLRKDVLPAFTAWSASRDGAALLTALSWWTNGAFAALQATPELTELTGRLGAWSARWHLTDAWLLADTRNTLSVWHQYPPTQADARLGFHSDGRGMMVPETVMEVRPRGEAAFELELEPCRPFEPTLETWHTFEERVQAWKQRNRAAAAYMKDKYGLAWSDVKRARHSKDAFLPFEWLARYQCLGHSYAAIGADPANTRHQDRQPLTGIDASNVRKAITKAAAAIGLTLRPASRGRPRK
jgi:hypothetical protein